MTSPITYTPVISLEALVDPSVEGDASPDQVAERLAYAFTRLVALEHQPVSKFLDITDGLNRYEVRFFSLDDAAAALAAHRAIDNSSKFLASVLVNYRRPSRIIFLGNGLEDWICKRGNKFLKMLLTHPDAAEVYANSPDDTDGFQLVTKKFAKRFNVFSVRIVRYYAFVECSTVHHAQRLVEYWQNRTFYEGAQSPLVMNFASDALVQVTDNATNVAPLASHQHPLEVAATPQLPPTKPMFIHSDNFESPPQNVEAFLMASSPIAYTPLPSPPHNQLQIMERLLRGYNAPRHVESPARIVVRRFDCRETGGIMMPLPAGLYEFFNFGHQYLLKNPNERFVEVRLATNNAVVTSTNVLRDNDVVLLLKPTDCRAFT